MTNDDKSLENESQRPPVRFAPFETPFNFKNGDIAHPVYVAGEGPGVLLMHELPGITAQFWRLAHWIRDAGFSVYVPDLYAKSGAPLTSDNLARNAIRACVSREIHLFARNHSSPVTQWLRALARRMFEERGGRGVGAVGLCMTGNFALSLALEEAVIAPVASEPAMPLDMATQQSRAALHLSPDERAALIERSDLEAMALRFDGDPTCTAARFKTLRDLMGGRLCEIILPDSAKHPNGNPFPHAVLTKDLIDAEGEPTKEALSRVIAFLTEKLR